MCELHSEGYDRSIITDLDLRDVVTNLCRDQQLPHEDALVTRASRKHAVDIPFQEVSLLVVVTNKRYLRFFSALETVTSDRYRITLAHDPSSKLGSWTPYFSVILIYHLYGVDHSSV